MEGLPGVLGNKGTCLISTGNRGKKTKYLREQGTINHFRDKKLKTSLEVISGTSFKETRKQ